MKRMDMRNALLCSSSWADGSYISSRDSQRNAISCPHCGAAGELLISLVVSALASGLRFPSSEIKRAPKGALKRHAIVGRPFLVLLYKWTRMATPANLLRFQIQLLAGVGDRVQGACSHRLRVICRLKEHSNATSVQASPTTGLPSNGNTSLEKLAVTLPAPASTPLQPTRTQNLSVSNYDPYNCGPFIGEHARGYAPTLE